MAFCGGGAACGSSTVGRETVTALPMVVIRQEWACLRPKGAFTSEELWPMGSVGKGCNPGLWALQPLAPVSGPMLS
jgi:hypothetical protein